MDKTYKSFFLRVKRHQKAGFPRFKSRRRFGSITFPGYGDGVKRTGNTLRVQGVGEIEVKLHRPVAGKMKTVTVKRECGRWYVCFSVEWEAKPRPALDNAMGIDVGFESFATLSNGETIPNPRWYRTAEAKLRRAQRRVARRKRGSHRRRKAIALLQKIHARIFRLRNEFQHRHSFDLVRDFGTIIIEDLNVKGLAAGMLSKSVHDAGWSSFLAKLSCKAANAGRQLIAVNPAGTSQTCICGASVRKLLSNREHVCIQCGLIASRDVVSAQVILQRARISPSRLNVEAFRSCVS